MSFTVSDAFVQQYSANIRMLAQQTTTRLRHTVIEDQITGEAAYLDQLAPTAARKRTTRHGDSPIMNTQHLRRRVSVYPYEWGDLVDKLDKVMMLDDPTSKYAMAASAAMMRSYDDEIIAASWATAYTGHTGNTAVTWPNGNSESTPTQPGGTVVAVNDWTYGNGSGNIGLTVSKLLSANAALDAAEGDDEEERYCVFNAKQKANLLSTTEATSADYNTVRALNDGKIDTFCGFKFIRSERLQLDGSGYTRVMAYRKSALGLGIAQDINGQIDKRADKSFAWYVYADMNIGASRLEEVKLVEIKCL